MAMNLSRRRFLRSVGIAGAGLAAMLAGCQPVVVKETVVVKEAVEVEKEVTRIVEKPVEAKPTRGPVKLVAWSLGEIDPTITQWKPYQDAVFAIMKDKMPEVSIENRDMGWDEVLRQNLVTGLLGGTAPDIIVGESFIQPYARIGAFLPLDDPFKEAGIYDNLILGVQANSITEGRLFGYSLRTGVFAFESNPQVVEKAGLDPSEWPDTWSKLLERCAAITKAGNGEYYGYTLQGPVGFLVGGIMRYNVYSNLAGAPMCKNDCQEPFFDDPKLEKPLAFLREINKYTPPGLTFNPDEGQVYQQLHKGVTAYQIGANWHLTWAVQHGIADIIQYGPLPKPDEGGFNVSRTVGNKHVNIMSGTKYPAEAIEFVKILTMDDVTVHVYTCSDRSPSTYSGLQRVLPNIKPQHKVFFEILQSAEVGCMPQWPKAADKIWAAVNEMMTKLFTTDIPIPDLQAEAQQAAMQAIAEA